MLKIKKFVLVNKVIVMIFTVVLFVSVAFAANMALKTNTIEKTSCVFSEKTFYFSDASRSTVVGYSGYLCDGTFVKSGKRTRFTDTLICDCFEDTE